MSAIWRTALARVQRSFEAFAASGPSIACVLRHEVMPKQVDPGEPPFFPGLAGYALLAFETGMFRSPRQGFEYDAVRGLRVPKVGDRVTVDANGEPLLFPDGTPVDVHLGFSRKHQYYGLQTDPGRHEQFARFQRTAADAGRIVVAAQECVRWLWQGESIGSIEPTALWCEAMFQAAWRAIPGSPLTAKRFCWSRDEMIEVELLSSLLSSGAGDRHNFTANLKDPPDAWVSCLADVATASAHLVDLLLNVPATEASDTTIPLQGNAAQLGTPATTGLSEEERAAKLMPKEQKVDKLLRWLMVNLETDPAKLTDREAYDWLKDKENRWPDTLFAGAADYELPAYSTFERYCRSARRKLGENKNSRKSDRTPSRSVVRIRDLN
jgi:hypothetical protein